MFRVDIAVFLSDGPGSVASVDIFDAKINSEFVFCNTNHDVIRIPPFVSCTPNKRTQFLLEYC